MIIETAHLTSELEGKIRDEMDLIDDALTEYKDGDSFKRFLLGRKDALQWVLDNAVEREPF